MFSSTELETAVRLGARFVHLVWDSGTYDMVAFQEQAHYGKTAGIQLGHVDIPKFAESFGCRGVAIRKVTELGPAAGGTRFPGTVPDPDPRGLFRESFADEGTARHGPQLRRRWQRPGN